MNISDLAILHKIHNVFSYNITIDINDVSCYNDVILTPERRECMGNEVARTSLYMNKNEYEKVKDYCNRLGISVNGLIKVLLDKHMREVNRDDK